MIPHCRDCGSQRKFRAVTITPRPHVGDWECFRCTRWQPLAIEGVTFDIIAPVKGKGDLTIILLDRHHMTEDPFADLPEFGVPIALGFRKECDCPRCKKDRAAAA